MNSSTRQHLQRIVCFAAIVLPVASTADNDRLMLAATEAAAEEELNVADRRFLQEIAVDSIQETYLSRLAAQKAPSPAVRVFAQRLANDQTQFNEQLRSIAQAKGVSLPTDLDARRQKTIDSLEKLDGATFERAYLKLTTEDQQKDIKEFRKQVQGSQDSDVKSFAASTLPKLHDRLALVREAARTAQPAAGSTNRATATGPRRDATTGAVGTETAR
jgi:putative membrane protein